MRALVESDLPCDADRAWAAVQTSALLLEVVRPLVAIRPLPGEAFPERWTAGMTLACRSYLFGVIPLGTRTLAFESVDPAARAMQTRERDALVRRWDHRIAVRPLGPGQCRYSDDIEIEAGLLTPAV